MPLKTKTWDPAEHLKSEEAIAAYLTAAFEDGDPAVIAAALGDVARARGMTDIARDAGVSRESLYRSLSPNGNPELGTVVKVAKSFGLQLVVKPIGKTAMAERRPGRTRARKFARKKPARPLARGGATT